jgi:hypothetical protein
MSETVCSVVVTYNSKKSFVGMFRSIEKTNKANSGNLFNR